MKDSGPDRAAHGGGKKSETNTQFKFQATHVTITSRIPAIRICATILPLPITGTSAAQNVQVINICSKCGAILFEDASRCSFCDAPLTETAQPDEFASVAAKDVEPDWHVEVARRLELYRARRRRVMPDDTQSPLPFQEESHPRTSEEFFVVDVDEELDLPPRPARKTAPPRAPERVEISPLQPEFDFSASGDPRAHPQTALIPVADLHERRQAGLLDLIFLTLAYVGFLGLFRSLGGHFYFARVDAAVYGAAFILFYALYFSIFTIFGGATPGMQLRGLYVVRLDGQLAENRQLQWRAFAYLLSGGALMLGFLWAFWDEDHFTWHDRISHTYVTSALPLGQEDSFEVGPPRQTLAHK
jgi:uncharacterized RDD family membrane protein YckC